MTTLLVMRHAKSDWSTGLPDHERPLNPRGEDAADRMAQWLAESGYCPDHILTSSAERTQQTVAAVQRHCTVTDDDIEVDGDLYLASANAWLRAATDAGVHTGAEYLLLCGHNPGVRCVGRRALRWRGAVIGQREVDGHRGRRSFRRYRLGDPQPRHGHLRRGRTSPRTRLTRSLLVE